MGYSKVNVHEIERDGMAFVAVGARRGSYERRGHF
jgi:hypothetical protein